MWHFHLLGLSFLSEFLDQVKEKAGSAYGDDQLADDSVSCETDQAEDEMSENGSDDTDQQAVDIQIGFPAHEIVSYVACEQTDDDHTNDSKHFYHPPSHQLSVKCRFLATDLRIDIIKNV